MMLGPARSKRDSDGWISALDLPLARDQDFVLVIADPPLRTVIASVARGNGYQVLHCSTPLDGIQLLERFGSRIVCAILSSAARWGFPMRALIADEYPAIRQVALVG